MNLTGARVWVVGASSGIGADVARLLVDRGAEVAVSARRADELETVAGGRMLVVPVDVRDGASVHAAADRVRDGLGGLDVLVYGAGTWLPVRIDEFAAAPFETSYDVNVLGLVRCLEAVLPGMRAGGAGRVVGIASVAGYRGLPNSSAYGSTKAAELNLLESLRGDLAVRGVVVQTISPGFVRTPMTARNRFPMPFLISSAEAARQIVRGVERDAPEVVFPLRMALLMKAARLVPVRLWSRFLTAQAKRSQARAAAR